MILHASHAHCDGDFINSYWTVQTATDCRFEESIILQQQKEAASLQRKQSIFKSLNHLKPL